MGNIIKGVDKVGSEVGFNHGRKPRFQTISGGILTIIAYTIIAFVTFTFFNKMYINKDVDVSLSNRFVSEYPEIKLIENNFYPILGVEGKSGLVDSADFHKYVLIFGSIIEFDYESLKPDAPTPDVKAIVSFAFLPCSEVADNSARDTLYGSNPNFRDFGQLHGLCPDIKPEDLDKVMIKNSVVTPPYRFLQITVIPCVHNSALTCASEDEINGGGKIIVIMPKLSFDPDNQKQPVSVVGSIDEDIFLSTLEVYDDVYDFFPEELHSKFSEVDKISSNFIAKIYNQNTYCDLDEPDPTSASACEPYATI